MAFRGGTSCGTCGPGVTCGERTGGTVGSILHASSVPHDIPHVSHIPPVTPVLTPRVELVAHAVLDVVVDDEVQLFFRETVVLRQKLVDFVDDGLGELGVKLSMSIYLSRENII